MPSTFLRSPRKGAVPDDGYSRGLSRWLRHKTGGFDREAFQWLLATLGLIASLTGVVQFFAPGSRLLRPGPILAMVALGAAVGVTLRLTRRSLTAVDASSRWRIHVAAGDVLRHRPAVITTDTARSFRAGEVSPTSLIGQYLASLPEAAASSAAAALEALPRDPPVQPGDVQVLGPDAPRDAVWLLACGSASDSGTVTTWSHLMRAYDGLWHAVRRHHVDTISVPVIGAGFSRTALSPQAVLLALILSFHAASVERPVCSTLNILVPPKDFDLEQIVVMRRILSAMHYTIRL
jgi:hypothetical protein